MQVALKDDVSSSKLLGISYLERCKCNMRKSDFASTYVVENKAKCKMQHAPLLRREMDVASFLSPWGFASSVKALEKTPAGAPAPTLKPSLKHDPKILILTLSPNPIGRDLFGRTPTYRLKQLLKSLLRYHGFVCVGLNWSISDSKTP